LVYFAFACGLALVGNHRRREQEIRALGPGTASNQ
jgi:hypothetical protein